MYNLLCTEFYNIDKKFADSSEVNFYSQFFRKEDLILEPMCGSGRLLIPLIQRGFTVHGVDSSQSMLDSCKNRAMQLGLELTLYQESIEQMKLPCHYDWIVIPLGSFQLLFPRIAAYMALTNLKKHLKSGGKIILDLFIPWDALYENNQEEISEREVQISGGKIIYCAHNYAHKYEQYIFSDAIYKKIFNNKIILEEKEQMYICWYYRYEMELMLEKFGFKNIEYREEKFTGETNMIFIAEAG